jgi:hypothetical protein
MNDKQMAKLIRDVSKQAEQRSKKARFVDPTLEATNPDAEINEDTTQMFKDMKRREF